MVKFDNEKVNVLWEIAQHLYEKGDFEEYDNVIEQMEKLLLNE